MKTIKQKTFEKLIWACAWCSEDKQPRLKKGQEFTHGICNFHKLKLMASIYSRKVVESRW